MNNMPENQKGKYASLSFRQYHPEDHVASARPANERHASSMLGDLRWARDLKIEKANDCVKTGGSNGNKGSK